MAPISLISLKAENMGLRVRVDSLLNIASSFPS